MANREQRGNREKSRERIVSNVRARSSDAKFLAAAQNIRFDAHDQFDGKVHFAGDALTIAAFSVKAKAGSEEPEMQTAGLFDENWQLTK